jgi:hypothetical protein
MMLVKGNKDYEAGAPPNPDLMAAVAKAREEGLQSGVIVLTGGLLPSSHGARIRVAGGKLTVIDGPFAEAKELVGGYAILNASSKEEAIEMGKGFMSLHAEILGPSYEGELEVRQVHEFPE